MRLALSRWGYGDDVRFRITDVRWRNLWRTEWRSDITTANRSAITSLGAARLLCKGRGMIRVLIVDRNHETNLSIAQALSNEPDVTLLPDACNVKQMLASIMDHKPHVVFGAVEILEAAVRNLREVPAEAMPVVIPIVPNQHHAIQSLKTNALEVLVRPFDGEDVRRVFRHARLTLRQAHAGDQAEHLLDVIENSQAWAAKGNRLFLKSRGKVVFVDIDDIDWVEAAANYVHVHAGSDIHSIRGTISAFELQLDAAHFMRIHRSAIVNVEKIKELQPCRNGDFLIILRNGKELPVSRNFRGRIHELVKGLERRRPE